MDPLRQKWLVLGLFGALAVVWALWIAPDAYLVNDEALYHLMTLALLNDGTLSVWNGYEEFPSAELAFGHVRLHDGHLYSPYPILFPLIAAPFVALLGFKGFYLLNTLALLAAVVACYRLARLVFNDSLLAANACLILVFATFVAEYGPAAWPHTLTVALATQATHLACIALRANPGARAAGLTFGAGFLAGVGIGIRLDTVFVVPALMAPFLFASPWRPREALATAAGTFPALVALAIANDAKFGVYSPFSYGETGYSQLNPDSYAPLAALAVVGGLLTWLATRARGRSLINSYPGTAAIAVLAAAGGAIVGLDLLPHVARLLRGAYTLVVDITVDAGEAPPPGTALGPGGSIVLLGSIKKSLLQSCPYLAAVLIPGAALVRGELDRARLGLLFLVPASFIGAFSYFAWHGGGALNLRYFLPALPFLSILVAYAWREIGVGLPSHGASPWLIGAATAAIAFVALFALGNAGGGSGAALVAQTVLFRGGPIAIFLAGLVLLSLVLVLRPAPTPRLSRLACEVLFAGFIWAGLTAYANDFLHVHAARTARAGLTHDLLGVMEPDSIVFTNAPNLFYRLLVDRRVRVAETSRDAFAGFDALRRFQAAQGRAVYVFVERSMAEAIAALHLLDGLETRAVYEIPAVGRLLQVSDPAAPAMP